ncbi:CBS domain-containing protein [Pseudorhodoplanes sp.]|uniref:CBS domain-containing protein n=1 Tax=Pseudorhodoplanes sp. TaxID=1934341 RepID=UPI002D1AFE7C|nr:CBS domain-containing protein [Pseudorhodoplanes sp.]HWV54553.1 CBS domain-containing protein [Pseudorhodoplanes sp.]
MRTETKLFEIARLLREGQESPRISVRTLLEWFGAQRRGSWLVWHIRSALDRAGLSTEPDFESAYIDSYLSFVLVDKGNASPDGRLSATETDSALASSVPVASVAQNDPTYRISKLAAANKAPVFVAPNASLERAVTLMLTNDFSQLPVMTSEREVKGVVSWASIGARLASGQSGKSAQDVMDHHQEIRAFDSLFQAIPIIIQHQYVLVRAADNRITGIVTASDLSEQFQQLAEPFLLLGEIENHIRRLLDGKFSSEELGSIRDPEDSARSVSAVADLTFGEYVRLIEKHDRWTKLGIAIDRQTFCDALDDVRRIRNDVMHFDPDGVPPSDLDKLRKFTGFLSRLQAIGVS